MDNTDKKIIKLLSRDAGITATEIGEKVNLSIPAVNKRIQKLCKDGIITDFTIMTDAEKVGKPITAFVLVVLQSATGIESLLKYVREDLDVLECHAVTGEYDYLIKVCAEDIHSLENKLLHMKKQKGVIKSHTMLSLMKTKNTVTVLPE